MAHEQHLHAEFDEFPRVVEGLIQEFGIEGISGTVERIIAAERAEFFWEGRIAEIDLGEIESFDEDDIGCRRVRILGYFRGGYYVAEAIADEESQVISVVGEREFERLAEAESAFLSSS